MKKVKVNVKDPSVVLTLAGLVFCWFSYGGLSDLFPLKWAIPLAFLITVLWSMACVQAGRARGWGRAGFVALAFLMWVAVTVSHGLSFNQIISHEGGDRVRTSRTAAAAHFGEEGLQAAQAELDDLRAQADGLAAEAAELEAKSSPAILAGLQAALDEEGKTGRGKNFDRISGEMSLVKENRATAAGRRAQCEAVLSRIASQSIEIAQLRSAVASQLTEAAVSEDTQHFIFNLASAYVGRDRDKTGAFLSAIGSVFFGSLELVFGVFLMVSAARTRAGEVVSAPVAPEPEKAPLPQAEPELVPVVAGRNVVPFDMPQVWRNEAPEADEPGLGEVFRLVAEEPEPDAAEALDGQRVYWFFRTFNDARRFKHYYSEDEMVRVPLAVKRRMVAEILDSQRVAVAA